MERCPWDSTELDGVVDRLLVLDERMRRLGRVRRRTDRRAVLREIRSLSRRVSDPVVADWIRDLPEYLLGEFKTARFG